MGNSDVVFISHAPNKANSHFLHSVVWRACAFVYIRHQTELVSFTQSLHYKKKAQSVKLSWMNNDSRVESFGTVPFWSHWQTTVAMRDYWNIAFCQLSQISVPQQKIKYIDISLLISWDFKTFWLHETTLFSKQWSYVNRKPFVMLLATTWTRHT